MKIYKTVWHNIRRSPYQAIASVLIMTLVFLLISYFTYVLHISSKTLSLLEAKPAVTAFFHDEVKQEDIRKLEKQFREDKKVSSVKFVSKEDALKIYKEQNKSDPLLLELVTADILPASLEVSTIKIQDLKDIYGEFKKSSLIENIVYHKEVVSDFTEWITTLRETEIGAIIILSVVSIFVIVMIIGIKISNKREEINIMRLVGASKWYIRWPFIFEGLLYGFIGAILGWTIASVYLWFKPPFPPFMQSEFSYILTPIFLLEILLVQVFLAIILSFVSSFLAVLRYLK